MSDVYIAYRREDREAAERLAAALEQSGLSVWWDRHIDGGEDWRARIETELAAAGCVIVLWSKASVGPGSEFVQDEAERARERGVLVPVLIDKVRPPVGFGARQTTDLSGWKGALLDAGFLKLRAAIQTMLAGGAAAPAVTTAPRRLRMLTYGATALALFSSVVGFFNNVASVQQPVCKVGVVKACLCRPFGLGGVPTKKEETSWRAATARTDGDGLRDYLARYPSGVFSTEAQARLAACRVRDLESWQPDRRAQPLIVPTNVKASASEAAARADALGRAKDEARFVCGGYAQGEFRLTDVEASASQWRCSATAGWRCGFDGTAVCKVDVRHVERREVCAPDAGAVGASPPAKAG